MNKPKRILVTGSAGFIGFHTCRRLLAEGVSVLGVDNFTPYYDLSLKERRTALLGEFTNFELARVSINDRKTFPDKWERFDPQVVIHLAAQAGVRYSIDHPDAYIDSNLNGTFDVLELARHSSLDHLLVASTSSVYGANTDMPFGENQKVSHPLSLYAATKGATELMGHSYAHLFGIPCTFFRFFTVYGPWGRPDMALFKFIKAMLADEPIQIFNNGQMVRDFTYVEDLVEAIIRLIDVVPGETSAAEGDSLSPVAPFRVVNIGAGRPSHLMDYIGALETCIGRTAKKEYLPMQPGDVPATEASAALLSQLIDFTPSTKIRDGVSKFVDWYLGHYEDN